MMTETEDKQLDDQLAEFTDRLLEKGEADGPGLSADNQELRVLQETVVSLKKELAHPHPDMAMAARIRAGLVLEWRKLARKRRPGQTRSEGWLERIRNIVLGRGQPRMALGFAAALVVVLIAAWLFIPDLGGNLTGTAGVQGEFAPLLLLASLVVLVILIWLAFRRR